MYDDYEIAYFESYDHNDLDEDYLLYLDEDYARDDDEIQYLVQKHYACYNTELE
jgi:hypothetical protein